MSDPLIIRDVQISVSDGSSDISSLRTTNQDSFNTSTSQLNITIVLTSPMYPSSPQLGQIDLPVHSGVSSFSIFYKSTQTVGELIPFNNNNPSSNSIPSIYTGEQNVVFPDQFFADEILIIVNKEEGQVISSDQEMSIKLNIFACFGQG